MPEIGQTISHYRIMEKIGQGGMGEVYLADDTTLDRKVALKFLPEAFTSDPERMARFEREAKLLASLNHPNIAGIYGLEQADGNRFLALEYVEGETLKARLSKGALPLEDALALCRQIAEGLEAAHEKGVIHRDLKPANVMITAEERVKILDFGLAKAFSDDTQSIDSSQSPTLTEAMTRPGVILGTAAYMSPEQAKGKSVDKRADIWAFGCILYECLTGKKAFEGETVTETLAAVIKEEPDIEKVPAKIQLLLRQCLVKDKKNRLRDIGDFTVLMALAPETDEPQSLNLRRPWIAWSVAIICLVFSLILSSSYFLHTPVEAPEMRLQVNLPSTADPRFFALSPNGRYLVYVDSVEGKQKLWLRPLAKETAHELNGTADATYPFWSSDSRSIGFCADLKLKRIDLESERTVALADAPDCRGGTWNRDGVIVFAPSQVGALYRVPAAGDEDPVQVTQLDESKQWSHIYPQFLPDGRHLLFSAQGSEQGVYLTTIDSLEKKRLVTAVSAAAYVSPGYLFYIDQGILFAQPFDASERQVEGDRFPLAGSADSGSSLSIEWFSASETGLLAYGTNPNRRRLAWFDRDGNEIGTVGTPDSNNLSGPELSPDYRHVSVTRSVQGMAHVFLVDTTQGTSSRLTLDSPYDYYAVWSPEGNQIVFASYPQRIGDLYVRSSDGSGKDELLYESPLDNVPFDWSNDGKFILYLQVDPTTAADLWALQLDNHRSVPVATTSSEETLGQFSPDSRWVAYMSNESGSYEVYVQSFPDPSGRRKISQGGGIAPRWHPKGKEIYYIAPDGRLMARAIQASKQTLELGPPIALFQTNIVGGGSFFRGIFQYAVASDGKRFLINIAADGSATSSITIYTNWFQALKR